MKKSRFLQRWNDDELDELLLALMEHPPVGYYLRRHGLHLKVQEIERRKGEGE